MKIYSFYKEKTKEHKSYSAFYRWAIQLKLFVTKNGLQQFGCQTVTLSFLQSDGTQLTVTKDKKYI